MISQLWSDAGVHDECYSRRTEFNIKLIDSGKYFLDSLDRICGGDDDYVPTEEDVLRVYVPTLANVTELATDWNYKVLDVSQQNAKKWSSYLGGSFFIRIVLYVVDISEYDKVVYTENEPVNCLAQSVSLFKEFVDSQYLRHCSERLAVFVLLNKCDIFKEKVKYSDLKNNFPAFEGPTQDYTSAVAFIKSMFSGSPVVDICALNSKDTNIRLHELIASAVLESHIEQEILISPRNKVNN